MRAAPDTQPAGRMQRQPLLWLATGCACALVAVLALEYHSAVTREMRLAYPTSRAAAPRLQASTGGKVDGVSPSPQRVAAWTRLVLARPVFSATRRPNAVSVAGPRQPRLAGIVLGPSGRRAIFAGDGGHRGIVAAVGQQAGDWRVQAIEADSVRVIGPAGVRTLHPTRDDSSRAADSMPGNTGFAGHPSILDLLRSRPMQLGLPGLPMPPGSEP